MSRAQDAGSLTGTIRRPPYESALAKNAGSTVTENAVVGLAHFGCDVQRACLLGLSSALRAVLPPSGWHARLFATGPEGAVAATVGHDTPV